MLTWLTSYPKLIGEEPEEYHAGGFHHSPVSPDCGNQ